MTSSKEQHGAPTPQRAIRRFDVFAEYTRQERLSKGDAEDVAKGYGIWLAKVVAARRFGKASPSADRPGSPTPKSDTEETPKFRAVGDELQTDETFDHDIIDRMGADFYEDIFVPAITAARAEGRSYEEIRDEFRRKWKPASSRSR